MAQTGQKLTEILEVLQDLRVVVEEAQVRPFTVQSDFARGRAIVVALAASLGYITTLQSRDTYGKRWMVTGKGMTMLEKGWYV